MYMEATNVNEGNGDDVAVLVTWREPVIYVLPRQH